VYIQPINGIMKSLTIDIAITNRIVSIQDITSHNTNCLSAYMSGFRIKLVMNCNVYVELTNRNMSKNGILVRASKNTSVSSIDIVVLTYMLY